jgi:hypothetical protein
VESEQLGELARLVVPLDHGPVVVSWEAQLTISSEPTSIAKVLRELEMR